MTARGGHPGPTDGLIFQRGLSCAGRRIDGFLASSVEFRGPAIETKRGKMKRVMGIAAASCIALTACVTTSVDKSYDKAQVYGWEDEFDTVVLHLHGCGGDPLMDGVMFMLEQGYTVVVPDSFADPRPGSSCSPPWIHDKNEIMRIRIKQAEYALERIRLEYPGKKVIVWGHSEGGGVANAIDEPVDGVITTGYQCGYRSRGGTHVRKDVPLLAIIGDYDPMIEHSVRRYRHSSIKALCRRVMSHSSKWKHLIVNAGHRPSMHIPAIREALLEFLLFARGQARRAASYRQRGGVAYPDRRTIQMSLPYMCSSPTSPSTSRRSRRSRTTARSLGRAPSSAVASSSTSDRAR